MVCVMPAVMVLFGVERHYDVTEGQLFVLRIARRVQECMDHPDGEDALFIKFMLAAVEYEVFIQMMREVARDEAALGK